MSSWVGKWENSSKKTDYLELVFDAHLLCARYYPKPYSCYPHVCRGVGSQVPDDGEAVALKYAGSGLQSCFPYVSAFLYMKHLRNGGQAWDSLQYCSYHEQPGLCLCASSGRNLITSGDSPGHHHNKSLEIHPPPHYYQPKLYPTGLSIGLSLPSAAARENFLFHSNHKHSAQLWNFPLRPMVLAAAPIWITLYESHLIKVIS